MTDAAQIGRDAERSDWLDHVARIGLVAYGAVYLLVGWLAIQLALGDHGEDASPQGAMSELSQQPFGEVLVWAVGVGLAMLVVWRVVEAAFGHRESDGAARTRKRLSSAGKAVIYAALAFTAFKIAASGSSSDSDSGSETMTAKLMDLPAGQWIVVGVGLAIIAYAVGVAWSGWREKFAENLQTEGKLGYSGAGYLILGKVGHIAKGVAFGIVGGLFVYAGATHESGKSGGLDQALQKVLQQPFGPFLLGAIAAGIICYGLFCFAWARHLDR